MAPREPTEQDLYRALFVTHEKCNDNRTEMMSRNMGAIKEIKDEMGNQSKLLTSIHLNVSEHHAYHEGQTAEEEKAGKKKTHILQVLAIVGTLILILGGASFVRNLVAPVPQTSLQPALDHASIRLMAKEFAKAIKDDQNP